MDDGAHTQDEGTRGKAYKLAPAEGQAHWFTNALVTIKAGGAETGQRLTIAQILHPAGYSPPTHRHLVEDESFYILSGTALFESDGERFEVGPGDFAFLPRGSVHTFAAGSDGPFSCLVITVPAGFENFVAEAGTPAERRELPDPVPVDGAALAAIAARHQIEILGPPLSARENP
ncbi:Cupin domain-containing protein [Arthrobacter subterraneus]|uniref:Cupin domain-containing protein n=1 Tax=Arthrobacter subterraneus TaxID=335973 RepID=A0A1G8M456_9MICC|nr:cupin domain-containing protein [Arthrobacter subterraneus]SDI62726.1 Cupin domain-containing protein [Arthrobacter subterraneus]